MSYAAALGQAGLERLDVRRCALRERFAIKLSMNPRFESWLPLSGTPVYPLRQPNKYVELPFRTKRLRAAPLYSFRRILNHLDRENANE